MPNARQISQRINELLEADSVSVSSAELSSLATSYADLSRRAHDRLARCHDLLAEGLRSEAIQEADLEPSLLKLVAALEIKDFRGWSDCCQKHNLPLPSPLSRHVAAELNRGYAADQLVAPLLREYRFRCLARRPLTERIAALRGVAGLDQNNNVWNESLVLLETHRLDELPVEIERALGNVDALRTIQRELLDDRRRIPAPAAMINRVEEGLRTTLVTQAQDQLRTLLPALNEAYTAMDYRVARGLLESWDATLKSVGQSHLHLPDDLREPVQPVMDWVQTTSQQQEREIVFRQESAHLRSLVDSPTTLEELDQAFQRASQFDLPLPDNLAEDTRRARQKLVLAAARRRRNRLVAVAGVGLALVACVGWGINQQIKDRKVTQALNDVERGMSERNLQLAHDRFELMAANHPSAMDRPDVNQVKHTLDQALAEEQERFDAFVSLLSELEKADDSELSQEKIDELEGLARLGKEKSEAREVVRRHESWQVEQRRQREADALATIDALQDQLNMIPTAQIDSDPHAVQSALAKISKEISNLSTGEDWSGVTTKALEAVAQRELELRKAVDYVLDHQAELQRRQTALTDIVLSSSQTDTLANALKRYAANHPEDAIRSRAFTKALENAQAWRAVEAWQALSGIGSPPDTLSGVAQRLRDLDSYLQAHPRSPVAAHVEGYRHQLAQALLVSSNTGPWLGRLPEVLRAPVIRDLNVVSVDEGRRYYVVGKGNRRETSLGTIIDVVLTPDITKSETVNIQPGQASDVKASAQSKLASTLLAQIADYELSQWNTFHLDLIETILDEQAVDTVLRSVLVTMVIDEAENTLGKVHPELSQLRKQLNAQNEDGLNWLDPDDIIAATVREYQDKVIAERRPDFNAIRRDVLAETNKFERQFHRNIDRTGVLLREDGKAVVRQLPSNLPEHLEAYIAEARNPESPYVLRKVGEVISGKLQIKQAQVLTVPEGSMVFLLSSSDHDIR